MFKQGLLACLVVVLSGAHVWGAGVVHEDGIYICAVIVHEMSEAKIGMEDAERIAGAIADAGNRHFGRVTCGDMWLYMAMVFMESGFKNNVVNSYNCWGMFQVHAPSWAGKFGVRNADLLKVDVNADIGIQIFKYYLYQYRNVLPALSAYNSDHPDAALGYAYTVLSIKRRIKKRYSELYRMLRRQEQRTATPVTCGYPVAQP